MGMHYLAKNVLLNIIVCAIRHDGEICIHMLSTFQKFN